MELAETLNRTMKLAMDEGRVSSYQEAVALFSSFRLRVHVQPGFTDSPGAEAAVLTLLCAAPKTFLGGVELVGAVHEICTLAWFHGCPLGIVAAEFGLKVREAVNAGAYMPTLHVGVGRATNDGFWLGLQVQCDGFTLTPEKSSQSSTNASVEAGVAAAGAALHQAFQHIYRKSPQAGEREVAFRLPAARGANSMRDLWLVGLGHLGQAYLWTLMLQRPELRPAAVRLTDDDKVSRSSLSTCLLVDGQDVGSSKVKSVAKRLEALGVQVKGDPARLNLDGGAVQSSQPLCIIAVDNLALRRSLDRLQSAQVLEAGIGDGPDGFARVQAHAFPGPRLAMDVWAGDDPAASKAIDISKPAYKSLLEQSGDECGTTLVAGRSIATPFIGAFAGAVLARLSYVGDLQRHAWNFDVNAL
jgi:hypothetical protein